MTYSDSTHAGSPFGARWDDGYPSGPAPRAERYDVTHPWTARVCEKCERAVDRGARRGGCPECYPLPSPVLVPDGPGPDDALPCTGKWHLFDTETPEEEALSLCASCPFRDWCNETAIANREHGTWAGTTYEQRKFIKRYDEQKVAA